eukprot:GCRY01002096.1.p1 GENE.GCRY01002096.1~~GCRY01002096.1.p1  ORF type:complete len:397 (-),score=87.75 GCRY01002096.1:1218-2312(-)
MVAESAISVGDILRRLLSYKGGLDLIDLSFEEYLFLIHSAKDIFKKEKNVLELSGSVNIVGDIHGQYGDLLRIFNLCGSPRDGQYLFLGDYVDRGHQSLEVIALLLAFKICFPQNIFLLRGNHECRTITRMYGFHGECQHRYSEKLWEEFSDLFDHLPLAALVENKIFCVHAGLSPELKSINDIRRLKRPQDIPEEGLLCDLLWADPSPDCRSWAPSERGVSQCFGVDVVNTFLANNDLELIVRAHQVVPNGFEFMPRSSRRLLTLFSAPNYCGEMGNEGAVLTVTRNDENDLLDCTFHVFAPGPAYSTRPPWDFQNILCQQLFSAEAEDDLLTPPPMKKHKRLAKRKSPKNLFRLRRKKAFRK